MSHLECGSVVWVRLGQAWWPGTITTVAKCPPEFVQELRKTPHAIVKFFHENEFQDVNKAEHIFPYNCDRKEEFIRKGQCINKNQIHGDVNLLSKFESDVVTAEKLTGGDMNILKTLEEIAGKRRIDYSDLGFGQPKKKKREEDVNRGSDIGQAVVYKKAGMKVAGTKGQRVVIRHEVCIREQPKKENGIGKQNIYKCYKCGYTCGRLDVIVWHNKAHLNKVASYDSGIKIPGRRKRKQGTPKSSKDKKNKLLKGKENLEHVHTNGDLPSTPKKELQDTQQILMDWEDEEEDGERSTALSSGLDKQGSDDDYSDDGDYPPPQPKDKRIPMPKPADINSAFDALLAATPATSLTSTSHQNQSSKYVNNDSDSEESDWEKYYANSGSESGTDEVAQESDIKSLCEEKLDISDREGTAEEREDGVKEEEEHMGNALGVVIEEEKDFDEVEESHRSAASAEASEKEKDLDEVEESHQSAASTGASKKEKDLDEVEESHRSTASTGASEKEKDLDEVEESQISTASTVASNWQGAFVSYLSTPQKSSHRVVEDQVETPETSYSSTDAPDNTVDVDKNMQCSESQAMPVSEGFKANMNNVEISEDLTNPPENVQSPEGSESPSLLASQHEVQEHHEPYAYHEPEDNSHQSERYRSGEEYSHGAKVREEYSHRAEASEEYSHRAEAREEYSHKADTREEYSHEAEAREKYSHEAQAYRSEDQEYSYEQVPYRSVAQDCGPGVDDQSAQTRESQAHNIEDQHIQDEVKEAHEPYAYHEPEEYVHEPLHYRSRVQEYTLRLDDDDDIKDSGSNTCEVEESSEGAQNAVQNRESEVEMVEDSDHSYYESRDEPQPADVPGTVNDAGAGRFADDEQADTISAHTGYDSVDVEPTSECIEECASPVEEIRESSNSSHYESQGARDETEAIDEFTQNVDRLTQNIERLAQDIDTKTPHKLYKKENDDVEIKGSEERFSELVENRGESSSSHQIVKTKSEVECKSEGSDNVQKTNEDTSGSGSGTTYMLVAVDAHGNTVPTVPTPTLSDGDNNLVAVEATMEDGTTRTLYIDPAQLGPNVDLNNLMLHIDTSGQEHVIIPSSSSSESDTPNRDHDIRDAPSPQETYYHQEMRGTSSPEEEYYQYQEDTTSSQDAYHHHHHHRRHHHHRHHHEVRGRSHSQDVYYHPGHGQRYSSSDSHSTSQRHEGERFQ